jgi:threonine dehydrogenase-like Zn-dependent dehydrogenase
MLALRIVGERQVVVRELPDPSPRAGEVVIRLRSAGICGSDLHPYRHPPAHVLEGDVVPGHEPAGEIVAVGQGVGRWSVGDRAVVYFRRTCGECVYCRTGHRNVCINRRSSYGHATDAPGSDAEYMVVEAGSLIALPEYLGYVDGAILACQAGTAYWPLVRLGVSGRHVLAVSGLGPLGLLATLFATAMGSRVLGVDPSSERRRLAKKLGASVTLDPLAGPVAEQLREAFPDGADALIETSGASAAQAAIGDLLKPRGHAAIVGLGSTDFAIPLMRLVHREITVFGASIYPDTLFPEICQFVRTHGLRLDSIVSHTFSLTEGPEAFRTAESATAGKVMFRFE